jgi:hypothetical protein
LSCNTGLLLVLVLVVLLLLFLLLLLLSAFRDRGGVLSGSALSGSGDGHGGKASVRESLPLGTAVAPLVGSLRCLLACQCHAVVDAEDTIGIVGLVVVHHSLPGGVGLGLGLVVVLLGAPGGGGLGDHGAGSSSDLLAAL